LLGYPPRPGSQTSRSGPREEKDERKSKSYCRKLKGQNKLNGGHQVAAKEKGPASTVQRIPSRRSKNTPKRGGGKKLLGEGKKGTEM